LADIRKAELGGKEASKDWPPTVNSAINEKRFLS
jgi:hypothetical protein